MNSFLIERATVAANEAGRSSRRSGAPRLHVDSSRQTLIRWLCWNDPNGCYTDEATAVEDIDPTTLETAWELIIEQTEAS